MATSSYAIETRTVPVESYEQAVYSAEEALTEVLTWYIEDGWQQAEFMARLGEKWDSLNGELRDNG